MFEDEEENFFEHDVTLVMDQAKEPIDICWNNMGGTRGLYFWRRFFLLLVCLVVTIFFSTPGAILAALKRVDILKLSSTGETWVKYIPVLGDSIINYLPPLIVLLVN